MTSLLAQLNSEFDDATAIAEAVRSGEISAVEVVDRARRARKSATNAFITEEWGLAADTAEAIDARRARGAALGPLAGVPISVKDVIAVAGLRATAGSEALADNIAAVTAPAVQRLLEADAIIIGKTNCPEFAFGVTCDSPIVGPTGNPRFPEVSPGGSSGGEAAVLAAGISALGVGTDFGGSLRWPAQCVGITALRPTAGVLPPQGQLPGAGGDLGNNPNAAPRGMQGRLQTIGPMARSVRDLRLAFDIMSGGTPSGGAEARRLRIVWSDGAHLGPVRAEITTLLEDFAARLADNGHTVRHQSDIFTGCLPAYNTLRALDPLFDHAAAIAGQWERITFANHRTITDSLRGEPDSTEAAKHAAERVRGAALTVFEGADIVLLPVAGGPACDPDGRLDVDGRVLENWELMGQCRAVSLTGAPVVSLPIGRSNSGLPLSVQVIAAPDHDHLALTAAALLETHTAG